MDLITRKKLADGGGVSGVSAKSPNLTYFSLEKYTVVLNPFHVPWCEYHFLYLPYGTVRKRAYTTYPLYGYNITRAIQLLIKSEIVRKHTINLTNRTK